MQDLLLMAVIRGEGPLTTVGTRGYPSSLESSGGFTPSLEPIFWKVFFVGNVIVYMYFVLNIFSFSLCAEGDMLSTRERRGVGWSSLHPPCKGTR